MGYRYQNFREYLGENDGALKCERVKGGGWRQHWGDGLGRG